MNNARKVRNFKKSFTVLGILLLMVALTMGAETYAKKKKGQNKASDDEAAQKKYKFELLKSWSFGYENYKNKQFTRAAKHFWKVTNLDTIDRFPKVYRLLGDCYFKMNIPDSAQIVFELGIKMYPDDAHLHLMVGFLKAQRGQVDEAILEYERVSELDPESKDPLKQLASLYVKADRVDEAIATYNKILKLDPNDLEAQQNQSALFSSTGDIEGAIENKEKVRAQQPDNSQVRFDLGKMYFEQENFNKSIELFNEFLALSLNDVDAMEYIANSQKNLGKLRNAIAEFKKILHIQPDNKKVIAEISRSYKELGNFRSAKSFANKALAIDRSYGLGWIVLGEAYEASAEACVNKKDGKVDFNDKLVYEIAANKYKRAKKDLTFLQEAQRHLSYLQGVLPSKEDKFMHKDQKKPEGQCYTWF